MTEFSYYAFAYRQTKDYLNPYLLSFVAPVNEVAKWAGVPRRDKSDGFQRTDNSTRVETITKFFKDHPDSQSPTSIVIGIPKVAVSTRQVTVTPLFEMNEKGVQDFLKNPTDKSLPTEDVITEALKVLERDNSPILCRVTFLIDLSKSIEEIASAYHALIVSRLNSEMETDGGTNDDYAIENHIAEGSSVDSIISHGEIPDFNTSHSDTRITLPGIEESVTDEEQETDEELETDEEQEDGALDIRQSALKNLEKRLLNPDWVKKHDKDIRDLAKPATIIDGQHRVLGASQVGAIPFNIVALMEASWAEQVFQFTILNYTAKPLPGQFIAGNAAITLTRRELNGLRDRLKTAGIKIKDVDIFSVLGADSRSPFYDLICVGEHQMANKLGYSTMMSIGLSWMDAKPAFLQNLLSHLYPSENKRSRQEKWIQGVWETYCWAFWSEVKDHFFKNDEKLWVPGGGYNLMVTAVLRIVQNSIFDFLDMQINIWREIKATTDDTVKHMRTLTKTILEWIDPELFKATWAVSGIQGSPSERKVVEDTIRSMILTRGKFGWRNSKLVKKR